MRYQLKLLIANQSEEISKQLRNFISPLDYISVVGKAENVREASVIIELMNPDVIILNIQNPENGNITILNNIRDKQLPIKIIIFSSHPEPFYKHLCIECGTDFFLETSSDLATIPLILKKLAKAA